MCTYGRSRRYCRCVKKKSSLQFKRRLGRKTRCLDNVDVFLNCLLPAKITCVAREGDTIASFNGFANLFGNCIFLMIFFEKKSDRALTG